MGTDLDFPRGMGVALHTARQLLNKDWPQYDIQEKTLTFAGATTNDPGDYDGTGNPSTLFTVTGTVELSIIAICTVSLVGTSATAEIGTAATTAGLIALTTATEIDANDIWHDTSPDATVELTSVVTRKIVSDDVICTVKTANITAGAIKFIVKWSPISSNGNVVAA